MSIDGPGEPARTLRDLAWPRHTERLSIRPATDDDIDAIWAYRGLPESSRWMRRAFPDVDSLRGHFDLATTLAVEHEGRIIGDLWFGQEDGWSQAEVEEQAKGSLVWLGWTLAPEFQGRGFATEMVAEVIDLAVDDLGIRRICAACFALNERSWQLMERLGMRREQHGIADSLHRELGWVDGYTYAILAEEWRAHRSAR